MRHARIDTGVDVLDALRERAEERHVSPATYAVEVLT
jgi:hypothetical protein